MLPDVVLVKLFRFDFSSFCTYRHFFAVGFVLCFYSGHQNSRPLCSLVTHHPSPSNFWEEYFRFLFFKVCITWDFCGLGATQYPTMHLISASDSRDDGRKYIQMCRYVLQMFPRPYVRTGLHQCSSSTSLHGQSA